MGGGNWVSYIVEVVFFFFFFAGGIIHYSFFSFVS